MASSMANDLPPFRYKKNGTLTWGAGGNTLVLVDGNISSNSQVEIWVTGTSQQAAGQWSYQYPNGTTQFPEGQVTITSSSSESSTLPLAYYVN